MVATLSASAPCGAQAPLQDSLQGAQFTPDVTRDTAQHSSPYLYPPHIFLNDRTYWTVAGSSLFVSVFLDRTVGPAVRNYQTPFLTKIAPVGDILGTANYTVPTITTALIVAHLTGNARWEDATRHITMSYILADVTEALLKGAVGRQRPDYTGNPWVFHPIAFKGEFQSFPSGHVTHITAIAAAFAQEVHQPWATALSASAVAFTGWQRLYRNQHWLSDVVGGAIVGTTASRVTAHWLRHHKKPPPPSSVAGGR